MLRGVEGISFVQFDDRDVVRHSLVQKIVKAYERYNEVIGANRQLSLKLADRRPRRRRGAEVSPKQRPEAAPMSSPERTSFSLRSLTSHAVRPKNCRQLRTSSHGHVPVDCLLHAEMPKSAASTGDSRQELPHRRAVVSDGSAETTRVWATSPSRSPAPVPGRAHGHSLADELRILMLHGALHLLGLIMKPTPAKWRGPRALA